MSADLPALGVALGDYPHTAALRSGHVGSELLRLDFAAVSPISRAFAPMVREHRYDVSEMAIATFLQAKSFGKPLVLLPVVLAARFQEAALLCRQDSDIAGPADLAGRRVGVRAYSQTTGMWLRGILADEHGVRPEAVRWVTFEDAHVAEYRDPPFAERARPGDDMMAMLHRKELDAVIVGNDVPKDARLRTVFPDPATAGAAFRSRHGFVPPNHLLVCARDVHESRPDLVRELLRMMEASADLAPPQPVPVCTSERDLAAPIELALRYCGEQGLVTGPLSLEDVWKT